MSSGPDLKLRLIADYKSATDGVAEVRDSLEKLHQKMLSGKATMEEYSDRLVYDLGLINKNGHTIKSVTKSYELLTTEMEKLRFRFGESSEQFQSVSAVAERYKQRLDALRGAEEKRAKAIELHKKALADAAYEADKFGKAFTYNERESLDLARQLNDELEKQRQNIAAVNAKNADIGFMMVTGDEQGVAAYSLREYENTLKKVIAETGVNSEETKKAYEQYAKQKEYLDELNESTKKYNTMKEASVKVEEKHSLKLLSVAKNILKFQLLMGPITAVVRGFRTTLSDSVKVAAEAEQRFNKLATVFNGFEESARRAATSLASILGVANSTSASALSTVGDLLQAQGMGTADSLQKSVEWVKQFQDIIAFKDINMTLEEFAQNFMSGAAGNLRNFRTFGSIVKESAVNAELAKKGLDKLTGSQLELAKMTTRATLALEQQKNAMGATQREWDTMLSVNRRLSESWKEYKENLGDTINAALKPLKEWWTRILEETNKAKKAQEEYNKGAKESSVHRDVKNNPEDAKSFRSSLMSAVSEANITLSSLYDMRGKTLSLGRLNDDSLMSEERAIIVGQLKNIDQILFAFGVSVEDASEIIGKDIPQAAYRYLEVLEKRRKADKAFLDAQAARAAKLSSAADSFSALQETLLGITGVNFNPRSITELVNRGKNSDKGMNDAISMMTSLTSDIIKESFESLDASDLAQAFGDTISRELGEMDEADLLQSKADSYRKLFEAAWNAYLPDGIDSEEKLALEAIKRSYKEATSALEEYNKKLEIQKALLASNATLASVLSGTARTKYESGLTGPQSSKDLNMALNWDIPLLVQDYAKGLRESGVALKTVMERSEVYRNALIAEAKLKYGLSLAAEDAAAREGLKNAVPTTNREALANFGMSERDLERNQLVAKRDELASKHNSLWIEYQKEIDALDELTELEAQKALLDKVNPFVSTMEAYSLGQEAFGGGVMGGLAGVLADIAANTEAFQKLASIVTDHIVPVLDAFLEPLLPVIDVIGDLMQSLVQGILVPMFPLIVEICALVTLVVGTIKNIADLIVNTIKKVIGSLAYNIMRALDKLIIGDQSHWYEGTWMDQWSSLTPWETFKTAQEQLLDQVKEIRGLTFDIKENTDDKDLLATLKELYSRGIIDEQQFYAGARVKQKDMIFDPVSPTGDHYITNGNITIYVNGGDPAELRRTLEQFFDENNMHYNTAYGRY